MASSTKADEEAILTLADWAATAIENARLYHSERERRGELERAVGGLEATTEIARAVGGETRLDRILELIVKRGRALVEARWDVILLLEADGLVVTAAAGQIPVASSGCESVLPGRPAVPSSETGDRSESEQGTPGSTFALAELTGAKSGLIVPLALPRRGDGGSQGVRRRIGEAAASSFSAGEGRPSGLRRERRDRPSPPRRIGCGSRPSRAAIGGTIASGRAGRENCTTRRSKSSVRSRRSR